MPSNKFWMSIMTRKVFDCVDEHAGSDTIFIENEKAAFEKVMAKLKPVTNPDVWKSLTKGQIWSKLEKQAGHGGLPEGGFRAFLRIGTTCLNLSNLQVGAYSDAEIEASNKRCQNNNTAKSSTSTVGKARKGEPSNTGSSTTEPSKTKDDMSMRVSAIENSIKEIQNGMREIREALSTQKKGTQSSGRLERSYQSAFPQDTEYAQTTTGKRRRTTPPFSYKEVLDSQSGTNESDDEHAEVVQTSEHESQGQIAPDTGTISQAEVSRRGGEHTAVDVITSRMHYIQDGIFCATKEFLMSSKIDGNETIVLRADSYEDALNRVLCGVFGSGPVDGFAQHQNPGSPFVSGIKRCEIILATIGCAVTDWALRPLPQGEVQDGVLGEMNKLLQAQSPVFQDWAMETATRQYLEKHVQPFAKDSALVLAHELFKMLRHFLPYEQQQSSSQFASDMQGTKDNLYSEQNTTGTRILSPRDLGAAPDRSSLEQDESQSFLSDSDEETSEQGSNSRQPTHSEITSSESVRSAPEHSRQSSSWPPKAQKNPTRAFLKGLTKIFISALELRLDMEMKGNGKYRFHLPIIGTVLNLDKLAVYNKANNREIPPSHLELPEASDRQTQRRVLVGLAPIVGGKFRKGDRGGEWRSDEIVISKGRVHTHDV